MANAKKVAHETEFRHHYTVEADGRILYDAPMEILDQQDLDNYGITWDDCRTLSFNGSEHVVVYFYKTENRELAEFQWRHLDTRHSRGYANARCMIPGKRKSWIRCPDTISCARCPYRNSRKPPVISWDGLIETGYEPAAAESVEDQVMARVEYQAIRALMDAEDVRITEALEAKELAGHKVGEIAGEHGISAARVYQLLGRAKAIGRGYGAKNE